MFFTPLKIIVYVVIKIIFQHFVYKHYFCDILIKKEPEIILNKIAYKNNIPFLEVLYILILIKIDIMEIRFFCRFSKNNGHYLVCFKKPTGSCSSGLPIILINFYILFLYHIRSPTIYFINKCQPYSLDRLHP